MLTPAFEIEQDHDFITIIIEARMAKIAETEVFIEDDEFKFFAHPYFLRLTLPGKLSEDGKESGQYDTDSGKFTIRVPKKTPGEEFKGLDMLTTLLAPKKYPGTKKPLIEIVGDENDNEPESDDDEIDWQIEQTFPDKDETLDHFKYGFANLRSEGLAPRILEEYGEAFDLKSPEMTSPEERRRLRRQDEQEQFDPDHYLADLYDDTLIEDWLKYRPDCRDEKKMLKRGGNPDKLIEFSDWEREQLRSLPRKEYLIDGDTRSAVYLGLVDLVFAYSYDVRTTGGESNVESGWTVRKLSSTLSWFEAFTSIKHAVIASMRRSLTYPLYRNYELSRAVLKDTKYIFRLGKKKILRCLLSIRKLLRERDPYFVLNDLYLDDYCVWIQSASDRKLAHLSRALNEVDVTKNDLDLELEDYERAAELALQSDSETDTAGEGTPSDDSDDSPDDALTEQLVKLTLNEQETARNPSKEDAKNDDSTDKNESRS